MLSNPEPSKKPEVIIVDRILEAKMKPFSFKEYFKDLRNEWKQKLYTRKVEQGKVPHGRTGYGGTAELNGHTQIKHIKGGK